MRMKECLQVNKHGMFTCSNEIFVMQVDGVQRIQESKVTSLTLIKTCHFLLRATGGCQHEFRPPIVAAIDKFQGVQARLSPSFVEPSQELLKMSVYSQRFWFIEQLHPGAKP